MSEYLPQIYQWVQDGLQSSLCDEKQPFTFLLLTNVSRNARKLLIQLSHALRLNYGSKHNKCIEKECATSQWNGGDFDCRQWINVTKSQSINYHDNMTTQERLFFGEKPYDSYVQCPKCGHENYVDHELIRYDALKGDEDGVRFSKTTSIFDNEFVLYWPTTHPPKLEKGQCWKRAKRYQKRRLKSVQKLWDQKIRIYHHPKFLFMV